MGSIFASAHLSKRILLSSGNQAFIKHRLISSTVANNAEPNTVSYSDRQRPPPPQSSTSDLDDKSHEQQENHIQARRVRSQPGPWNRVRHLKPEPGIVGTNGQRVKPGIQQSKSQTEVSKKVKTKAERGVRHFKPHEEDAKAGELVDKAVKAKDPLQHIFNHPEASIIIRDACKCSRCKDPSTNQREFNVADIPVDLKPSKIDRDTQGNWNINWENDIPGWENHTSVYTPHQIDRLQNFMKNEHHLSTHLWKRQDIEKDRFSITYDKYMTSDVDLAESLYHFVRHGLVFITDVPEDEASVKRLAQRIAAVKSTFYGETWDVRSIPEAKNVAYTSKHLGFHSDLLYTKEPPTVQYLHCLHNSTQGGESRFVDQFKAFDVLSCEHPELANILVSTRLRYEYENDGFYYSDIKPIVQRYGETHRFPQRHIHGAEGPLKHRDVYRMFWSPQFLGSIINDNGQKRATLVQKLTAMKKYTEILEREDLVYQEKMEPGTCVMFDNLRVLHARNEFDMNSGKRWLRGAYLDGQDLWSMEMKLKEHIAAFASPESQAETQAETT